MKLSNFQLTRSLFLLMMVILVIFGIGSPLQINGNPNQITLYVFYGIIMFGDAAIISFCALQLNKRTKWIYSLSVLVLALNIFLTVFDQFGLVDLLFLFLNLATLIFLIIARKEFRPA